MKKFNFWKYCPILFSLLVLNGCLSGSRPDVKLSPKIDDRVRQISPLHNTVGIYIDPALRNYVQKEKLTHYNIGIHYYTFPIGQSLAPKIEEMSKLVFRKVIVLDNLQGNKEPLDGIITFSMKSSEIELQVDESVWRAIGRHKLSIITSFLDPNMNKLWKSDVAVEGKGIDFVSSRVEYEWWVTAGPKFAPAVDDAIEMITYALAQKLTTSKEIIDYLSKGDTSN